ncbi:MAG: prolipoprotein diacylglyceryl transferase family protein [Candidatus Margulisiibacteriota bacterium]
MRSILFRIPVLNIPIHAYGVMVVVGFIIAIMISTRRAKKWGFNPDMILDLGVYIIISGVLGARIWFVAQFGKEFDFKIFNVFDGRLSLIGLIIGVLLVVVLYLKREKIQFLGWLKGYSKNVKIVFILIGIVSAFLFSRALYCLLDKEANMHVAYVENPSLFKDIKEDEEKKLTLSIGGKTKQQEQYVIMPLTGKYASGENAGKTVTIAYEFPKYRVFGDRVIKFSKDAALQWLKENKITAQKIQPAFYYDVFQIWNGGLVYFGGVLGAIIGGGLFCLLKKVPFWRLADLVAPGIAFGLSSGRVGCLLNGCCWGKIPRSAELKIPNTELAQRIIGENIPILSHFSASFPRGSNIYSQQLEAGLITTDAARSLPVYLTQPMETIAAIAIGFIVLFFSKHKKREGEEFLLLWLLYAVARFFIELLRADNEPEYLFGLTVSQSAGMFIFIVCALFFIIRRLTAKPMVSE